MKVDYDLENIIETSDEGDALIFIIFDSKKDSVKMAFKGYPEDLVDVIIGAMNENDEIRHTIYDSVIYYLNECTDYEERFIFRRHIK